MFCKIYFRWEGGFTIAALVWFLSKQFLKSFCKYLGMLEKCIPIDALVWFLLSMCLLVFYKMIILGKKHFPISDLVWFPLTSEVSVNIITMTALVWVLFSFIPKIFYTHTALWLFFITKMHWYGFSPVCILRCLHYFLSFWWL